MIWWERILDGNNISFNILILIISELTDPNEKMKK